MLTVTLGCQPGPAAPGAADFVNSLYYEPGNLLGAASIDTQRGSQTPHSLGLSPYCIVRDPRFWPSP